MEQLFVHAVHVDLCDMGIELLYFLQQIGGSEYRGVPGEPARKPAFVIVQGTPLFMRQYGVSFVYFPETGLRKNITGVFIRMKFMRQPPERLFDVFLIGLRPYFEGLIIVFDS